MHSEFGAFSTMQVLLYNEGPRAKWKGTFPVQKPRKSSYFSLPQPHFWPVMVLCITCWMLWRPGAPLHDWALSTLTFPAPTPRPPREWSAAAVTWAREEGECRWVGGGVSSTKPVPLRPRAGGSRPQERWGSRCPAHMALSHQTALRQNTNSKKRG